MRARGTRTKALQAIDRAGIANVFPLRNAREPTSLWYELYPQREMRWDWGADADDRVVDLWHLRTELSQSREVVYAKWFRGRATFFSRPVFVAMLRALGSVPQSPRPEGDAGALYERLLDDSPQTPRLLRAALGLEGRAAEAAFVRAQRELWERLLIVGFGEVDDGAFPSLAIGATRILFEDLWDEAAATTLAEAHAVLAAVLARPGAAPFAGFFSRIVKRRGLPTLPNGLVEGRARPAKTAAARRPRDAGPEDSRGP